MGSLFLLLRLAVGNLFASALNIIVGLFIAVGALLLVVFSSMLGSVDAAISRSITGSISGDVQVYSAKSKDELSLFAGMGGDADLTAFESFDALDKVLRSVPNVREVVPMGLSNAIVTAGNDVDLVLENLRATVNLRRKGDATEGLDKKYAAQKRHVQQMAKVLLAEMSNLKELAAEGAVEEDALVDLQKASADSFWAGFDAAPLDALEFLENRVAPWAEDGNLIWIQYFGTDMRRFPKVFDRFRIVDGEMVPPGQRGFMLAKMNYEDNFKLKNARRLDKMDDAMRERQATIATDQELQRMVRENKTQLREIVLQLDELESEALADKLRGLLKSDEKKLPTLLASFFDMTDGTFGERYRFFYSDVAPMVELYKVRIGDTLTLKTFTRNGFASSVNVRIYGTFEYSGLEKSPMAGQFNVMDLMSFRALYGYETAESRAEMQAMKKAAQAQMIDRDKVEDALFGNDVPAPAPTPTPVPVPAAATVPGAEEARPVAVNSTFTDDDIRSGVVLNAAVLLHDASRAGETIPKIIEAGKAAGLELKAVPWIQAIGMFGGFIMVVKAALYIFVFIIVLVSMVIINNALMMATLRRTKEIGTLRAIGAQSNFVLKLVLTETLLLGGFFGGAGALIGVGLMKFIGRIGIPATNDWIQFFFSGSRLHPTVSLGDFLFGLLLVLSVSGFAILYPAFLATRVSPLQAMQSDD